MDAEMIPWTMTREEMRRVPRGTLALWSERWWSRHIAHAGAAYWCHVMAAGSVPPWPRPRYASGVEAGEEWEHTLAHWRLTDHYWRLHECAEYVLVHRLSIAEVTP